MMEDSIPDHKLCGFLCTVLTVTPPPNLNQNDHDQTEDLTKILGFGAQLHLVGAGSEVSFRSDDGVVLSPIKSSQGECKGDGKESGGVSAKKWKRRIGLVHGSISVVHQLHVLVMHKCLRIVARSIGSEVRDDSSEARVMVLVDVYLPIALWSGWQFPKSGPTAGSLFKHLSCDWERRSSMLVCNYSSEENKSIWNISDCHVLGCKMYCGVLHSSNKTQFELHEIFKSLPSVGKEGTHVYSTIIPANASFSSGIWDVSEDVLINILTVLCPRELVMVSATCRRLRSLAASIMPCMKLKLFPHQQGAVEWMLQRERNSEVLPHPLYINFVTEDGFCLYINTISGEIVTGMAPSVKDFSGGMFCDEPGLGKTITALSLILKTQGTIADSPDGVQVIWCTHNGDQRCGYYEINNSDSVRICDKNGKSVVTKKVRRGQLLLDKISTDDITYSTPKRARLIGPAEQIAGSDACSTQGTLSSLSGRSVLATCPIRCTKSLSRVKRNLLYSYEKTVTDMKNLSGMKQSSNGAKKVSFNMLVGMSDGSSYDCREGKAAINHSLEQETWAQCDSCRKWRRLADSSMAEVTAAWFCSMNTDPLYQSCRAPEESWDAHQSITCFPGFHTKGTSGGKEENVAFFVSVLKDHYSSMNFESKKALTWLATLSPAKLSQMETIGLIRPVLNARAVSNGNTHEYHKIFQSFGLIKKVEKGVSRWYYPRILDKFVFDLVALQMALREPLDSLRLYLSRATLIVVPTNLVDHWKTQIEKHVRPGQLQVYVWTDNKKPSAHNLAWDHDVVITTFNRLSAEWGPHKRSALMQVHWLRIMLDEGHTLGASLNLTNKLQMAISLVASNRWLLTGTPTPNTPISQLSHLQPMLKFLHDEVYGQNQKSWDAGILRPFEAEMEEGRLQLLQLLSRCMISARKIDLHNIPPCIKKVKFLDFTEEHAKSYNELVVTVKRNILMADWNDPSHVESLLNPKQWKFRTTTIKNVRLSCCVAGHIKVTDAGEDILETMDILIYNGLDPISEEYAFIKYNILNGGNCMRCKEWCRLPVITPCRHLLCLDCVALNSEMCTFPGCGNLYEMQTPEILTRPENPNPKWPVPKDLIELQPSYKQDDWDPDWQSTSSSKVRYLVHRLTALQEANRKIGYSIDEGDEVKYVNELHSSPQNIISNAFLQHVSSTPSKHSSRPLPEKVLIFSQFLEHIHVIEQQLTIAGIKFTGMYSPMHASNKMKSLAVFQNDARCMVLLMDGSAALGLDLSFVTYVFLMEPIWNRSMEEQVISRAHRMGATRPIHVETLAMHGTIEEQMVGFLQDADECRRFLKEESGKPDHDGAGVRLHRTLHDFAESNYLAHLSFVRKNYKA